VRLHVQGERILIKHQAVRSLVERVSRAVDQRHPDADILCNLTKVYASDGVMKVARHMPDLHDGHGAMLANGVEKLFRDAAIFLHRDTMP
jgi:alkylation response protein AidB-like acyl-CoA dehydrogenase